MKTLIAFTILALTAGCAASAEQDEIGRADSETRLAAELRDYRQSGDPVGCVNLRNLGGNRSVGENAIIFSGLGGRTFVNRPIAGCPDLRDGRALNVRTTTGQLCRGDIVTVFDPVNGANYGSCALGDFTPYERRRAG